MKDAVPNQEPPADEVEISLLGLASILLRWRRTIVALGLIGGVVGLARGLSSRRVYTSDAVFMPQGAEASPSGLALAASQLGVRVPQSSWGASMYIELLKSYALLAPVSLDTVVVAEQRGRRIALMDLFEVDAPTPEQKIDLAVDALRGMVGTEEIQDLSAVKLSVTSPWPSVSLALAQRLVRGVNQFNMETRKSQAKAERQFVDVQEREAEYALSAAVEKLQSFLLRNRETAGSPVLAAERDRLQRDVALRQELHTSWLKSREDARIREVRDAPVITVFEEPKLAYVARPRGSVQKAVMGGMAGGIIGVMIALLAHGISRARRARSSDAVEFFELVEKAKPRFMKRVHR